MNRKGFTLIELVITIALLAVISLISFVSVRKILEQSKMNDCNTLVESIKNATKEYVSDNRYKNSFVDSIEGYQKEINGRILVDNKYLKGDIINPFSKESINPDDINIVIYFNRDYTTLGAVVTGPNQLVNDCKISTDAPANPVVDEPSGPSSSSALDPNQYVITLNGNGATANGTSEVMATYNSSEISPSNITLPERKYTITYDANGTGATVPSPSVVSYTFDGWYDDTVGTNLIINNSANLSYSNSNVSGYISDGKWIGNNGKTLYAKWIESSVRLGKMEYASHMCMWNTKADGTGYNYNADQEVTITGDITLYVKCKKVCCNTGVDATGCSRYGTCFYPDNHYSYCLAVINGETCGDYWGDCGSTTYYAIEKPCEDSNPGCQGVTCTNGTLDVNCNCIPSGSGGGGGGGGGGRVNIIH